MIVNLRFQITEQGGTHRVSLSAEGFEPVTSELEVDLSPASRLCEVIAQLEGYPQTDDLMDVGSQLWTGLLSGAIDERFDEICAAREAEKPFFHIRLDLPSIALERLPWETLYDEKRRTFLSCHPQYCVVREPANICQPAARERSGDALAVLVVIPEGSGLSVDREARNLNHAVDQLGPAIRLELLHGRVTPDRLAEKLAAESWDVFHYIGHGEAEDDKVRIRLNDEATSGHEHWMDAETFGAFFLDAPVRLAVLNCCLGAAPSPSRSLSGLGPILLRTGIPAVVAMRYEIPDDVANHFSRSFYGSLLEDAERGRIDRAVAAARRSIFLNHNAGNVRGFVTPVLYLVEGGERLPGLAASPVEEPAPAAPAAGARKVRSNPLLVRLVDLVRNKRCVPILGPGLMKTDGQRSAVPPPGRCQLAAHLAQESKYPSRQELKLCEMADGWIVDQVLQRVCQHFQHVKDLYDLVEAIHRAFRQAPPPPALLQLARWPTPGIVCTTFDGLVAEALRRQDRPARVVNYLDQEAEAGEAVPLLVHLRGTLAEQGSLVLTEEHHDRLWDRLVHLNSQIVELVAGFGRSMLLLGLSPQDVLIRRFLHQLLPQGRSREEGALFFVCPDHSQIDDAYWKRYDTQWLDEEAATVVQAVSDLLGEES